MITANFAVIKNQVFKNLFELIKRKDIPESLLKCLKTFVALRLVFSHRFHGFSQMITANFAVIKNQVFKNFCGKNIIFQT
jgi:hypothetical protein